MAYRLNTQLSSCITLEGLATTMENHIKGYGFAGFVYWTHLRVPVETLTPDNTFMVSRGPAYLKAFEALYFSKQLYTDDIVIQAAADSTTPFTTEEIRQQNRSSKKSRKQRWLYALEQRFGFRHDVYIPIHTPLRIQVVYLYFLGNDATYPNLIKQILPKLQSDIALFSACVVDFIVLGNEDTSSNTLLSAREQECLAWIAKGRSNHDIAQILNIKDRTVKFHVTNIIRKLNADNRAHAVAIAARSGWVNN